jgi:hypothetical protein
MVSIIIIPEMEHVMALLALVLMGHNGIGGTGRSGPTAWAEGGTRRERSEKSIVV